MSYTEVKVLKKSNIGKVCIVMDENGNEYIQKTQMRSNTVDREIDTMKKLSGMRYFPTVKQIIYTGDTVSVYYTKYMETLNQWRQLNNYTEHSFLRILFQIAEAIRILESYNMNHNDLFDENIMINPETMDVAIIDFGSVNYENFVYGRDLNYYLYILIHETLPVEDWVEELETLVLRKPGLIKTEQETDFQYGIRQTNIELPNKKTSGFEIMVWCLSKNKHVSGRFTPSFYEMVSRSYVGAFVGNAVAMPYEYHARKVQFDITNGSMDTDGSLSIYDIPAGSVTEDAVFAWSMFDTIRARHMIDIENVIKLIRLQTHNKIEPELCKFLETNVRGNTGLSFLFTWIIVLYHHSNTIDMIMHDIILTTSILEAEPRTTVVNLFLSIVYWKLLHGSSFDESKAYALILLENEVDMEFRSVIESHYLSNNMVYMNLRNILIACQKDCYESGIRYICECRGDTDTNAMIVGAIMGILHDIPIEWKSMVESIQSLREDNVVMVLHARID